MDLGDGTWQLSLLNAPTVLRLMVGSRSSGGLPIERWHPDFWCLNLYEEGAGLLRCQGREFALSPGCVSLTAPDVAIEYEFSEKATLSWVHFTLPGGGTPMPVPVVTDLGPEFNRLRTEMAAMSAALRGQPQRVAAWLWDLLWSLAERGEAGRPPFGHPAVALAVRQVQTGLAGPLPLAEVAATAGVSPRQLNRLFARQMGATFHAYVLQKRAESARYLLTHSTLPIKSIGAQVGFSDPQHFNKAIRHVFGEAPSALRAHALSGSVPSRAIRPHVAPAQSTEAAVPVAEDGRALATICLPANASDTEAFAAQELATHLRLMTGARLAVVTGRSVNGPALVVNDRQAAEAAGIVPEQPLPPEGFHLATAGTALHLLGGGPRGVLYAAYELLDGLGCRWYTPEIAAVPRRRRLALPAMHRPGAPAFEFRDTSIWEAGDPLWRARNRLNGHFSREPVSAALGGQMRYGLFCHTFWDLVPPAQFFDRHPEYFSLVGGQRRRDRAQLCLTNPNVVRVATEMVLERMRRQPDAAIFSVSQNDWDGWCECPGCTAVAAEEGSQAGPILRFVNAVAAATAKVFPEKLIDTIAYSYSVDAPRHVRPHPNVRVRLCPIACCQGHGFGTCGHPESARCLRALEAWSRLSPRLYAWHYCTNFAHYVQPMPNVDELAHDLALYRGHGVHGVFLQGGGEPGGGSELAALRGWVAARLLWQPARDVWALVDEFLPAYYGAAASQVRAYMTLFHDRVRANRGIHPSLYDQPAHPLFDGTVLARGLAALRRGGDLVQGAMRHRVKLLEHGLNYVRLNRRPGAFRRVGDVYRAPAPPAAAVQAERMIRDWRRAGLTTLHENATWAFSTARFLNRMRSHPVIWLRHGAQSVAVLPTFGGRLLEWHANGWQWLTQPALDNPWWQVYPLQEGYQESAYLSDFQHVGWAEPYRRWRGGLRGLTLALNLENGLRLERVFAFTNGALTIASRIRNLGRAPARCGWGAALRLRLPGPATIDTHAGTPLDWSSLPEGYDKPLVFDSERLPHRGWTATGSGFRLQHAFTGAHVRRLQLSRLAVHGDTRLLVDLRTDLAPLPPGAAIETCQSWNLVVASSGTHDQDRQRTGRHGV